MTTNIKAEYKRLPRKLKKTVRKSLVCHYGCYSDLKNKLPMKTWLDLFYRYNYYGPIEIFALEDSKTANQIRRLSHSRINNFLNK